MIYYCFVDLVKEKVDTKTELPDPSDEANESIRVLLEEKNNTCKLNCQLTHVMSISALIALVPIIIINEKD